MAAKQNERLPIDDILECKLCKSKLVEPQTLTSCFHSYCKTCLANLRQGNEEGKDGWHCFQCHSFTPIESVRHSNFIEDLQQEISISNKKNDKDPDITTTFCKYCVKKVKATKTCVQCKLELCDDCQIGHLRIPTLKDHTFVDLAQKGGEIVIDKLVFCAIHPSKLIEYNCETCKVQTCSMCNFTEHKNHDIETIDQALGKLERTLQWRVMTTIKSNQTIAENQIAATNELIEKTKKEYAGIRSKLDEQLDLLINKLKAAKGQMEEEVNTEESAALYILEAVRQGLSNEVSVMNSITNWITVVKEHARQVTLLTEFQAGLYDKAYQIGTKQKKEQALEIKLPNLSSKFITGYDIKAMIGDIKYKPTKKWLGTSGVITSHADFMWEDFSKLPKIDLIKSKEINLECRCFNISFIDGYLWAPLLDISALLIFNIHNHAKEEMQLAENVIVVKKATINSDVIAGGKSGLFKTNTDLDQRIKLADGGFCDICVQGHKFFALQFDQPRVISFKVEDTSNQKQWKQIKSFDLPKEHFSGKDIHVTIVCINVSDVINHILIGNCSTNSIYRFSENGDLQAVYHTPDWRPLLCGLDKTGKVLVVNYEEGKLFATDKLVKVPQKTLEFDENDIEVKVNCENFVYAVVDSEGHIWIIELDGQDFKIVKYF